MTLQVQQEHDLTKLKKRSQTITRCLFVWGCLLDEYFSEVRSSTDEVETCSLAAFCKVCEGVSFAIVCGPVLVFQRSGQCTIHSNSLKNAPTENISKCNDSIGERNKSDTCGSPPRAPHFGFLGRLFCVLGRLFFNACCVAFGWGSAEEGAQRSPIAFSDSADDATNIESHPSVRGYRLRAAPHVSCLR